VANGVHDGGLYKITTFSSQIPSSKSHLHQLFTPSHALISVEDTSPIIPVSSALIQPTVPAPVSTVSSPIHSVGQSPGTSSALTSAPSSSSMAAPEEPTATIFPSSSHFVRRNRPLRWVQRGHIHLQASTPGLRLSSRFFASRHSMNYILMSTLQEIDEPETPEEALALSPWRQAMEAEFSSIERNNTWESVPHPSLRSGLDRAWSFSPGVLLYKEQPRRPLRQTAFLSYFGGHAILGPPIWR